MSYTVTIKNNKTGEILTHEDNVEVIMGSMAIRQNKLRCYTKMMVETCNRTLCGNAWLAIQQLYEDLPKYFPWLIEAAERSKKVSFDTEEEMEAAIEND